MAAVRPLLLNFTCSVCVCHLILLKRHPQQHRTCRSATSQSLLDVGVLQGQQLSSETSGMGALLGKKKKNPNKDFLEKKYMVAVENVAHGEVIYSYVDMDSFEDVNECVPSPLAGTFLQHATLSGVLRANSHCRSQSRFESNVTTSLAEKPTRLADRLNAVEQARGKHSDMAVPFRIMHLAAELKGKRDVTKPGESVFLQVRNHHCRPLSPPHPPEPFCD